MTNVLSRKAVLVQGERDSIHESPINLTFDITTHVTLPHLKWTNAEEKPKLIKVTNSGKSVIISGKWFGPRPYISEGPFEGNYVFSQVHFHWGKDNSCGSEHTFDGASFPLEVHVMFFKSSYFSQEEAMKKLDGITVLAYLFKVRPSENKHLIPVINALESIRNPFTSQHIDVTSLSQIVPPFSDDYLMYWGNVMNSHKILWLINRHPLQISSEQVERFRNILDDKRNPLKTNYREIKSVNYRKVFLVLSGTARGSQILHWLPGEKAEKEAKENEAKESKKSLILDDKNKKKNEKKMSIKKTRKSMKRKSKSGSIKRKSVAKPNKAANLPISKNVHVPVEIKKAPETTPKDEKNPFNILLKLLANGVKGNKVTENLIAEVSTNEDILPAMDKVEEILRTTLTQVESQKLIMNKNASSEKSLNRKSPESYKVDNRRDEVKRPVEKMSEASELDQKMPNYIVSNQEVNLKSAVPRLQTRPKTGEDSRDSSGIRPGVRRAVQKALQRKKRAISPIQRPKTTTVKDIFLRNNLDYAPTEPCPKAFAAKPLKNSEKKPLWKY